MPEPELVLMQRGDETADVLPERVPVFLASGWKVIPRPAAEEPVSKSVPPARKPRKRSEPE